VEMASAPADYEIHAQVIIPAAADRSAHVRADP
jgi:hypothetical protein